MKPEIVLVHEFVESVLDELKERTLYVSIKFATVIHKCCCGCGRQVVTPLAPTRWKLTFDGKTISLHPSIGNWSMPCRSHYWIERNRVKWAKQWPEEQTREGIPQDSARRRDNPPPIMPHSTSPRRGVGGEIGSRVFSLGGGNWRLPAGAAYSGTARVSETVKAVNTSGTMLLSHLVTHLARMQA